MKELYTALAGAVSREKQLAVVTNNLANVNSVGFKRETTRFEVLPPQTDFPVMALSADSGLNLPTPRQWIAGTQAYVRLAGTATDFSSGSIRDTGNSLDLALESSKSGAGQPFFAVQTADGTRYTRAGNFALNEKQELVTRNGNRVRGQGGGVIALDAATARVSASGQVSSTGLAGGALELVYVDRPDLLEKAGDGLFAAGQAQPRAVRATDGVTVRQGCLEMANVNAVDELVRMIDLQRSYEAFQKTIQTMDDESGRAVATVLNG